MEPLLANSQGNSATFSNPIAVTVSGTYTPVLLSLLFMNCEYPISGNGFVQQ